MLLDEYPHEVVFLEQSKVPDGGGGYKTSWKEVLVFEGFLDTPTSRELFKAQQLNYTLDRSLYYPYRTDVKEKMRCQCEGDTYELVGKPEDQGGQHEVMKVSLKLVANG
jgi:SPP1 family predicted phage head-tail adaptor